MSIFFSFLFLLILCFNQINAYICVGSGVYEIKLIKNFGGDAYQESWKIERLYQSFSTVIYEDKGYYSDLSGSQRSTLLCLSKDKNYSITVSSSNKYGWGTSYEDNTFIELAYNDIVFYTIYLPYSTILKSNSMTYPLSTHFYITNRTEWHISSSISSSLWYSPSNIDYLNWSSSSSSSFSLSSSSPSSSFSPSSSSASSLSSSSSSSASLSHSSSLSSSFSPSSITHYYVTDVFIPVDTIWLISLSFKVSGGIRVYINGNELYRKNLPYNIDSNTLAIQNNDIFIAKFHFPLQSFLTNDTYIHIAVETHHYSINQTTNIFEGFLYADTQIEETCFPRSIASTITCIDNSSSIPISYNSCSYLLHEDTNNIYISATNNVSITITFNGQQQEWINRYNITLPSSSSSMSPSYYTWTVYGIYEQQTLVKLDYQEHIQFDVSHQTQSFFIFQNKWSFNQYRFIIENDFQDLPITLQFIQLLSCNHIPVESILQYSQDIYYPRVYSSLSLLPLFSSFSSFLITNSSFPEEVNVSIHKETGKIEGQMSIEGHFSITIQALDTMKLQYITKTLQFIVNNCSFPDYSYISILLHTNCPFEKTTLILYTHENLSIPLFIHDSINYKLDRSYELCISTSLKEIHYFHSPLLYFTSFLQIHLLPSISTLSTNNTLLLYTTCRGKSSCQYLLYPQYPVSSSSIWTYIQKTQEINPLWTTINYNDSSWSQLSSSSSSPLISSSIYLYRSIFTVTSTSLLQSISLYISTSFPFILYINGIQIIQYEWISSTNNPNIMNKKSISNDTQSFLLTHTYDIIEEGINCISLEIFISDINTSSSILPFDCSLLLFYHEHIIDLLSLSTLYLNNQVVSSSIPSTYSTTCFLSPNYHATTIYSKLPSYLFDLNLYTSWYQPMTITLDPIELLLLFHNHISLHHNVLCFITNPSQPFYDPYQWTLYGVLQNQSNDLSNSQYTDDLLYHSEYDIYPSTLSRKCYYLLNNTKSYQGYRLIFEKPYNSLYIQYISLSQIEFFSMNLQTIELPPFELPKNRYIFFYQTKYISPFFYPYGYQNYEISSSALPFSNFNSLHGYFNPYILLTYSSRLTTITATNLKNEIVSNTITLESRECNDGYSPLHLYVYMDEHYLTVTYTLRSILNNNEDILNKTIGNNDNIDTPPMNIYTESSILYQSKDILPSVTLAKNFCLDNGIYQIEIEDSQEEPWINSFISIQGIEHSFVTIHKPRGKYYKYIFNLNYILNSRDSNWKLKDISTYPINWNTLSFNDILWDRYDIQFSQSIYDSPLHLFRHSFTITEHDIQSYLSIAISINSPIGWVIHINGITMKIWNMINDISMIHANTYSIHYYPTRPNTGILKTLYNCPNNISYSSFSTNISSSKNVSSSFSSTNISSSSTSTNLSECISPFVLGKNVLAIEFHEDAHAVLYDFQFDASIRRIHSRENLMFSGEYHSNWNIEGIQGVNALFDNNIYTSVYIEGECKGIQYQWTYTYDRYVMINSYRIANGDDCIHLSPTSWILEGSLDSNTWILLDTVTYVYWTTFNQEYYFSFFNNNVYTNYRITIQSCSMPIEDSSCISYGLQLSEWTLSVDTLTYCEDIHGDLTIPYGHFLLFPCISCEYGYIVKRCLGNNEYIILYETCTSSLPSSFYYSYDSSLYPPSITNTTQGISPSSPFILYRYISISPLYPSISICNATYTNITTLPNGLYLNPNTGIITGIPTSIQESIHIIISINTLTSTSISSLYISITEHYCPSIDTWPLTLPGTTASIPCDDPIHYFGNLLRTCREDLLVPIWGVIVNNCTLNIPQLIYSSTFFGTLDEVYYLEPVIYSGLYDHITFIPPLPSSFSFNNDTRVITLSSSSFLGQVYLINISNTYGYSLSTIRVSIYYHIDSSYCSDNDGFPYMRQEQTLSIPCEDPIHYKGQRTKTCFVYGNINSNITSTCNPKDPQIHYPRSLYGYINQNIDILTPFIISFPPHILSISPSLPITLHFDTTKGILSGYTTTTILDTYTISITDTIGTSSISLYIHITEPYCEQDDEWPETIVGYTVSIPCEDPINFIGERSRACILDRSPIWSEITVSCVISPPSLSYPSSSLYTYVDKPIQPFQPTTTGLNLSDYSISPSLTNGLSFNNKTGIITGTASIRDSSLYSISVNNSAGTGRTTLYISIIMLTCSKEDEWIYSYENTTVYLWCGDGYIGTKQRTCMRFENDTTYWGTIDTENCVDISREKRNDLTYINIPFRIMGISLASFSIPLVYEQFRLSIYNTVQSWILNTENVVISSIYEVTTESVFSGGITDIVIRIYCDSATASEVVSNLLDVYELNHDFFKESIVSSSSEVLKEIESIDIIVDEVKIYNGDLQ
ncbi:hypothetical protein WA158_002882 [Blastocystis sp. Blastoise]